MVQQKHPIYIATRASIGQLINILYSLGMMFREHLHGNNKKKSWAFTMQNLLILNILLFILMLLGAWCFSFWNHHIIIYILTEKLIIISSCTRMANLI